MSFTYDLSSSDSTTKRRSEVRLYIPDNDSNAYELEDAELDVFIADAGQNVLAAAALACEWLSRKYAQTPTFTADGLRVDNSKRSDAFAKRAMELRAMMSGSISSIAIDRQDGYADAADE